MKVTVRRDGDIAVLALANPPVNALSISTGVVPALSAAVEAALADDGVTAIVLTGEGRMFSGGADINDFEGDASALTSFRDLLDRIEQAPKPFVAAIHGMALGGGLELALASHYRICAKGARLGLPEVKLGILPGAGGTQRLPRVIGFARAIEMMIGGAPIGADQALALGLLDRLVDGDVVEAALAFVRETAPLAPRPTGARPVPEGGVEAVAAARKKLNPLALSKAPEAIVACVEAVIERSLAEGLAYEFDRFAALKVSEASLGLRHAFFGERKVAQIPGLPKDTQPLPIASVAVIGAGTMGTGITLAALSAGLPVTLVEARAEGLERAKKLIGDTIRRDVDKGRLTAEKGEARLALLRPTLSIEDARDADLVIEAVFEDMAVKREVFTALDRIAKPSAILASNTSFLNVDAIADLTRRPQQVLGLHFFSPANIMRLLEIVRGAKTSPQVLATATAFARQIGKVGVIAGVCDGFVGNRIFEEYLRQAYFLAEEGASPQQIDAALEAWGWAMGPFRTLDLAGQDVAYSVRQRRAVEYPHQPYSKFPDLVVELGRHGQKTGKGVYAYPDSRTPQVDPEIEALLLRHSAEQGIERRSISNEEIVERCVLAMISEGARVVEEGIAYRPVDIDIMYLNGYGFPAERGGPMFYADRYGLPKVLERLEALARRPNGWVYEPAKLLRDLVARGETFDSLNHR